MGSCVSTPKSKLPEAKARGSAGGGEDKIQRPSTAKVVHVDGSVEEFERPVTARHVISRNPTCFLCSLDSLYERTCAPHVAEEEQLDLGQIYFLLPLSLSEKSLSLPDLCNLAIKACSAFGTNDF